VFGGGKKDVATLYEYWVLFELLDIVQDVFALDDDPGQTLIATTDDWMNIATGKLNPVTAFMQQKLKVKGDMGLAMKLQGLLQ